MSRKIIDELFEMIDFFMCEPHEKFRLAIETISVIAGTGKTAILIQKIKADPFKAMLCSNIVNRFKSSEELLSDMFGTTSVEACELQLLSLYRRINKACELRSYTLIINQLESGRC